MILNLDVLDNTYSPLDVSNILIKNFNLQIDEVTTDLVTVNPNTLYAGNTYVFTFTAQTGGAGVLGVGDTVLTSTQDGTINVSVPNAILLNGGSVNLTPAVDITDITVGVLSAVGDYTEDLNIFGEDITITVDDGNSIQVFTGTNQISATLVDNSSVTLDVVSSGLYSYNNVFTVHHNDEDITVLMTPVITDPLDPNYRKPYPNFFTIFEPCTYNIHIYDGQSVPFGTISYEESGTNISTGQRNYILNTCLPDMASITQRIVVSQMTPCGSSSVIIWDETFTINGIQTTEFKPEFQLDNEFGCCAVIDEEIVVFPEVLNMNSIAPHNPCNIATDPSVSLSYSILTPSQGIVALDSYTAAQINTGPLTALTGTFTPDELGTYVLTVTITNCCTIIQEVYNINICESWQITNTDCNKIVITNLSGLYTLTYSIKELTSNDIFELMTVNLVLQEDIVIQPLGSVTLDLVVDNLYTVTLITSAPGDTEQERIFLLDCNIKKCKKEFLIAKNCPPSPCTDAEVAAMNADYVHFKTLEEIIYYRWDEWVRQQSTFPSFSINDIMEDILSIKDVMTDLMKLCDICGIKEDDCGCS